LAARPVAVQRDGLRAPPDRLRRQGGRVGAHIGDVALLVEPLGDAHGVLGAHRELAPASCCRVEVVKGLGAAGAGLRLDGGDGGVAARSIAAASSRACDSSSTTTAFFS
jgi:hypothetical protein